MNDRTTVNRVVLLLGAVALLGVAGIIFLVALERPAEALVPLVGITGTAVGGLGGLLANTRSVDVAGLQELADAQGGDDPPPAG